MVLEESRIQEYRYKQSIYGEKEELGIMVRHVVNMTSPNCAQTNVNGVYVSQAYKGQHKTMCWIVRVLYRKPK